MTSKQEKRWQMKKRKVEAFMQMAKLNSDDVTDKKVRILCLHLFRPYIAHILGFMLRFSHKSKERMDDSAHALCGVIAYRLHGSTYASMLK